MTPTISIFPLNLVMFPEMTLPLRVFETRYLDMVSACLRHDTGFGINLIRAGNEVGSPADVFAVGTYSRIIDWDREDNGLLAIKVRGEQRFRIIESRAQPDNLIRARIEWMDSDTRAVPRGYGDLQKMLTGLHTHYQPGEDLQARDDAAWLGFRLAEMLPLPLRRKQDLLEMEDANTRLEVLQSWILAATADQPVARD